MMYEESNSGEDVQGLAGWMYTDLLLGLMVVFLATITFIPKTINESPSQISQPAVLPTPKATKKYSIKEFDKVNFIAEFTKFDETEFSGKIREFRSSQGVAASAKVLEGQFIGSYNPPDENSGAGIDRALEFGLELERAYDTLIEGVDVSVETFVSQEPKVLVRLTFKRGQ